MGKSFRRTEMEPAYPIPLTDVDLRALGQLPAIHAQIDYFMAIHVAQLLNTSQSTARKILGSTNSGVNADIWLSVFNDKCHDPQLLSEVKELHGKLREFVAKRNSLIHAVWGGEEESGQIQFDPVNPDYVPVAMRLRDGRSTPATEIPITRNLGAVISVEMRKLRDALLPESLRQFR